MRWRPACSSRRGAWVRGAVLALGVAFGASCTAYVKHGGALYAEGRYVEAAEVFERTEYRLPAEGPREQAEYGLYRGLTLMALGDLDRAERWLTYAYEVEQHTPGALVAERKALLQRGWAELRLRAAREAPDARAVGAASAAPSAPVGSAGSGAPAGPVRAFAPR
ncbi:MAG: hypothetical protein IT376_19690 [Polyangiaceae bacterium]|nr:hypothetical protein [Polyangiaceae bacterium]